MIPTGTALEQKKFPIVTATIIYINFIVFPLELYLLSGGRDKIFLFGTGALSPIGLITSIFLHSSISHIVFNMLYLWVFGPPVEERVGKKLFLYYYLGAGIAAKLLTLLIDLVIDPSSESTSLGASGAISGIMALYIYRCYYSKIEMSIIPTYFPVSIKIPALPFVYFWFIKNLFYAFSTINEDHSVNYWAHVGGFVFGLIVSRIKRYGNAGSIEYYNDKVNKELVLKGGWKNFQEEESLLKLAEISKSNPDILVQVAQYYHEKGNKTKASSYYKDAIRNLNLTNPLFGAFTILEHYDALGFPVSLDAHIKAATLLAKLNYMEDAHKAISVIISEATGGKLAEQAHILHIKICQEMGNEEYVIQGMERFKQLFPLSGSLAYVESIQNIKSGEVFKKEKLALPETVTNQVIELEKPLSKFGQRMTVVVQKRMKIISSPFFIFFWLGLYSLLITMSRTTDLVVRFILQVISFIPTYSAVYIYQNHYQNNNNEWSWRHSVTREDEEKAEKEFKVSSLLNKANLADRGEDYQVAAERYEKLLYLDPNNIQGRFRLAKIYQLHLNDRGNAIRQFRYLLSKIPLDHPYRHEAEMAIKLKGQQEEA
jgi:membrane associated rhomboid family serine protease/tetratricopeptide (TPR) repeat protein